MEPAGVAVERQGSTSTQNQAKSAPPFLCQRMLHVNLPWLEKVITARSNRKLLVAVDHSVVTINMIYAHAFTRGRCCARSPPDQT